MSNSHHSNHVIDCFLAFIERYEGKQGMDQVVKGSREIVQLLVDPPLPPMPKGPKDRYDYSETPEPPKTPAK